MARPPLALLLVVILAIAGCVQEPPIEPNPDRMEFEEGKFAPMFTLESSDGELWSLEEQRGKTVILAFVYTRCYETCPVISAALNFVQSELDENESAEVVFVSVTIDPYHDSPAVLQNWTTDRGYDWPHLTGTDSAVNPVLDAYDVDPIQFDDQSDEGYGFSHPQPTYIIDAQGYLRVVWTSPDWPADLFLTDLRTVMA
jgi:protein SCO1/2